MAPHGLACCASLPTVLDTLTAETPLVLVLEDLHWSDYATLDLLAFLARRHTPAQLLMLGTYRPVEVIVQEHPLRTVVYDLQRHGHGRRSAGELECRGCCDVFDDALPAHQFPDGLARGCTGTRTVRRCFWSPWWRAG